MNNDLLNILSNSNKDIDNQKLMDYLAGKLPEDQKNEVERWMADNDFANEAVEGLQDFKAKKDLQLYVNQLNKELNTYIQEKKKRRQRKRLKEDPQVYIAIVLIIVLAVIAWLVLNKLMK